MNPLFESFIERERSGAVGRYEMGMHLADTLCFVRRNAKGHFLTSNAIAKYDHTTHRFDFLINSPLERDKIFLRKLNQLESYGYLLCGGCFGWGVYWRHIGHHYENERTRCPLCGGSGRLEKPGDQLTLDILEHLRKEEEKFNGTVN